MGLRWVGLAFVLQSFAKFSCDVIRLYELEQGLPGVVLLGCGC